MPLSKRFIKKNLTETISENPTAKILFFDESRFGTHSKIGHAWLQKGMRSPKKMKLGFKNFYLYGAACPSDGSLFTLILPEVNVICFNIYLKEISSYYQNDNIILVMDGAGWHHSKDIELPENIKIVHLPPYSPELNPVERLWQYIKRYTIRNVVYDTLDELTDKLVEFIRAITPETISSVCSCNYL